MKETFETGGAFGAALVLFALALLILLGPIWVFVVTGSDGSGTGPFRNWRACGIMFRSCAAMVALVILVILLGTSIAALSVPLCRGAVVFDACMEGDD